MVIFSSVEFVRKQNFFEGLYYHIKHYHNNKQHFELNMPVKIICDNCKEYFSTLKLLEDYTVDFSQTGVLINQAAAWFWSGSGLINQAAAWLRSGSCLINQAAAWYQAAWYQAAPDFEICIVPAV